MREGQTGVFMTEQISFCADVYTCMGSILYLFISEATVQDEF